MKTTEDYKLEALLASIELPDTAYDKAVSRYKDLGDWLSRDASAVKKYSPHIYPQGSFALGTAVYPLNPEEDYDLDLTSKLQDQVSPSTHSQYQLKEMIRLELEQYRIARNIQEKLEEKRRCWRLLYKDSPGFHLDTVPGVPADPVRRSILITEMRAQGVSEQLLTELASEALWITDNKSASYHQIAPGNWLSSNPAGYVVWFRSRLSPAGLATEAQAKVDSIPVYRRKTPLQQVIQLLKRHRDVMYENHQDSKPISVIFTTIAAQNNRPTQGLAETLRTVLGALDRFRRSNSDQVLNPVNPKENFADKWTLSDCAHLRLKQNFHAWVERANAFFGNILKATTAAQLTTEATRGLKMAPEAEKVALAFGAGYVDPPPAVHTTPRVRVQDPPKPWRKG